MVRPNESGQWRRARAHVTSMQWWKFTLIIAAIWLIAVIAITITFAMEHIAWPELWLFPLTILATCVACWFAPKHRWRWLFASPLIGVALSVFVSMVVMVPLTHRSQLNAESWLEGQFSGAALGDGDEVLCVGAGKCSLRELANRHGGVTAVDCYDNIPFDMLGWECRATFGDGKSLMLDARASWARRTARASSEIDQL
jgi:hypothetical protein